MSATAAGVEAEGCGAGTHAPISTRAAIEQPILRRIADHESSAEWIALITPAATAPGPPAT